MDKEQYTVDESSAYNSHATYIDPATGAESKSGPLAEAGEMYGNLDTAEEFGYVHRGYVLPMPGSKRLRASTYNVMV